MSMGITGTTTFSEIYQQRTTEGGSLQQVEDGKHLRFKDDSLYTHDSGKSHGLNFIERAKKHQEAVKTVKASIDRELGPGQGDLVFKSLGLSNRKITVDQLERVHGEVERLKDIGKFAPEGITLKRTETGYQGRVELTWDQDQLNEMHDLMKDIKNSPMSKDGLCVTEQFMTDVDRIAKRLHKGSLRDEESLRMLNENLKESGVIDEPLVQGPDKLTKDTAVREMLTYTNSTPEDSIVCENLSRFLQQDMFSSLMTRMYQMKNEAGVQLTPDIDGKGSQRSFDIYKDGENYVIDLHEHSNVLGLTLREPFTTRHSETSTLDMTMRFTISHDQLKNGDLEGFKIIKGPTATLNLTYGEHDVVE